VIDPFCGSGTVLVEARLSGRRALGADLNPIAVMLSRLKTRGATMDELADLVQAAAQIRQHADDRRLARAGATRGYPPEDTSQFEPHVLLELDSLRDGIKGLPAGFVNDALRLVLSSLLTKVSRRQGDSGHVDIAPRRLAAGFTAKMFLRKTEELAERIAEFSSMLPKEPEVVRVELDDARSLAWVFESSADLAVSSPPYPGIYDYHAHHETRLRWLGLSGERFSSSEIGARRAMNRLGYDEAIRAFQRDMGQVLVALSRALAPSAPVVLVVADSVVDRQPVWIEPLLIECAQSVGYRWIATASQERPHFHAPSARAFQQAPRCEHLVLFRNGPKDSTAPKPQPRERRDEDAGRQAQRAARGAERQPRESNQGAPGRPSPRATRGPRRDR
jgi:hypothetical protein